MVRLILNWIYTFLNRSQRDIKARLYIHKPYADDLLEKVWAKELGIPTSNFMRTIYKPTGYLAKKRPSYMGCLRLEVLKSTKEMRKIIFWINLPVDYY